MNTLIASIVSRPRPALLVLVVLLIAGMSTYLTIPKESEPDVAIPIIYVNMSHEGISPEDAERLLVRPMEQALRTIEGLKEMRATATEGSAVVILEFEAGFNPDQALLDVREQVDLAKGDLPADTDEPLVQEVNVALFPVLIVNLHGPVPERSLVNIARELQNVLEGLPGVLSAEIAGDREELLEVIIEPERLESYNLSYSELIDYVSRNNRLIAAGALDSGQGRFSVKVPGVVEGIEDLLSMPVKSEGQRTITFQDIATVRRTFKDPVGYARLNGERTIALEISKRIGSNIVDVVDVVRNTVLAQQALWPESIQVTFTQDSSEDVRSMLVDLQNNVLTAVLLVMIVVLAALGPRSATLVGISIPGSFLSGILIIGLMGYSINIVVLFSLIMSVGMLVDGAIVVVEQAERNIAEGFKRAEAYIQASQRMAWPITASTATTLAAFMPLLFWPGIVGQFMKYLPITLIVTLGASLIMALLFVPTVGALIKSRYTPQEIAGTIDSDDPSSGLQGLPPITTAYIAMVRKALNHPVKVVALALAILIGSYSLYGAFGKGVEFFPAVEPTQAVLNIHARGDYAVDERDFLVRQVENRVLGLKELESVYTRTNVRAGGESDEDIIGTIQLRFIDWSLRRPADEILAGIRASTSDLAGIVVEAQVQENGPSQGKPIQIVLSSMRSELLPDAIATLRDAMDSIGDFVDVTDSRPIPGIDWRMEIDRTEAARFGADIATIGSAIQLITNGIMLGDYRPNDAIDEVDIRVRFPEHARHLGQLDQLRVSTPQGFIPVGNFVTRVPANRVGNLERTDGIRTMKINADVADGVLVDTKVRELQQWLAEGRVALDPLVSVTFKGEDQDQREAQEFLSKAFMAALFIMAIILVTQFNSFYQAFLILSAVIFSTVGVLLGLLITSQPFGIVMSGIGVISLAGIVVNNNIVLIDTYNLIRGRGIDAFNAALLTCAQRLRPVMLTTITTILGLMPMVFGMNINLIDRSIQIGAPSTQWWTQLATAVAGGLAFATLLTLVMTPCLLVLRDRSKT
jgi:multidrug efflux pump